ncbi:hypothetical protein [Coleofasciculus sp.]|uniref:hypothetical protein n=1 Tax=Coleofasciculus sp. TaxID=3100458 RepID=UPI003A230943
MRVSAKTIQILLTIIATILAIAALKATSAITIPLASVSLLVLLLLKVGQYREKIERSLASKTSAKVIYAVARMSDKLRGYILIQSLTCVLTVY